MSRSDKPSPMIASPALAHRSTSRARVTPQGEVSIPPDPDPEAVLEEIRELVTDHLLAARLLAAKAASRFPEHHGITNAHRILNQGKAVSSKGESEPPRDQELEWLRQPPESARGRWVALLGSELVGSAEKLTELIDLLRSKNLETQALVHHIDA